MSVFITHDEVEHAAIEYLLACHRVRMAQIGRALGVAQVARDQAHAELKVVCIANESDPSEQIVDAVLEDLGARQGILDGLDRAMRAEVRSDLVDTVRGIVRP